MLLSFTVTLVKRCFQIYGPCFHYKCVSKIYHLSIVVFDYFADVASFMFRIQDIKHLMTGPEGNS